METEVIWVLVMSSTRARIQRGLQPATEPQSTELVLRSEERRLLGAFPDIVDQTSKGGGQRPAAVKAAVEVLREDVRDFVREVIAVLEAHRRAGEFHKLALFAPSPVMAVVHNELPTALRGLVILEAERDLVRLAAADLGPVLVSEILGA